jgi:hypothetical protein
MNILIFLDSLLELEDDHLITKYYISYSPTGDQPKIFERSLIYINSEDIYDKIEKSYQKIREQIIPNSEGGGKLYIQTTLFLPASRINDISSILEKCLYCVNFLKDIGKDMGFSCNIKTHSPEGLLIEMIIG